MKLCGKIVKHEAYGRGKITDFDDEYITVVFDESEEEKKFVYPSAFGTFLKLEDESLVEEIKDDKKVLAEEKAEEKRVQHERIMAKIESKKTKKKRKRKKKKSKK
ncbi:hypothetical protein [Dethiothermospora halolimnae]|uniref:hypothetical protein n=1 Tax=Dethiothermospora halolimnae TaxID=3114390 RepID=UPI003CCC13ED